MKGLKKVGLKKLAVVVGAVAVFAVVVPQAIAVLSQGADRGAKRAVTEQRASLGAQRLVTATESNATTTSSTAFVNLTSTTIRVPAGQTARLVARFSAESQCNGGAAGNWCSVRILVDGTEMQPQVGLDFAFDSVQSSNGFYQSHSMDRTSAVLSPGNHTVTVQRAVTSASTVFRLDDYQLTVEEWRVS
jgi:hypothetical protein